MKRQTLNAYQRRLLVFLGVASFFEGYDFLTFAQILPNLRADPGMQLSKTDVGWLLAVINAGTMVAYFIVRGADRFGRKRTLSWTIAGYTVATFCVAFAPNVWAFGALQFIARIFLIAEAGVSLIFAAEEFPAEFRGTAIATINGLSSLGSIVCAGTVPLVLKTSLGWRAPYMIGVAPLLVLAWARRSLNETRRFQAQVGGSRTAGGQGDGQGGTASAKAPPRSFLHIWSTPYRGRLLKVGLIWLLTYVCAQNAVTLWKDHAVGELGMSDGTVGTCIMIAALVAVPLTFAVGPLMDRVGRRPGAVLVFVSLVAGVFGAYYLHGAAALTVALVLAITGASTVVPVLNAFNAEMFPTDLRGDAYGWGNNLIGRIGYVLSPIAVGAAAERFGWGIAVQSTVVFPIVALVLLLRWLPETRSKELEETAQLGS